MKTTAQRGGSDCKAKDVNRRVRITVNWLYSILWWLGWIAAIWLNIKGLEEVYDYRRLGAQLIAIILILLPWPGSSAVPLTGLNDDNKKERK